MEAFTYHDIFQTKGLEYIIIIAFLLIIIPFWIIINKQKNLTDQIQKVIGFLSSEVLNIQKGVYYSKNHTWAYLQKSGIAEVGLDDFLFHLTGKVKIQHLKSEGDIVNKGDIIAEIRQNEKVLKVLSPISGSLIDTNENLKDNPEIAENRPYSDGWIYKIEPSNWKSDTKSYVIGNEANNWLKQELEKFKDFLAISFGKENSEQSIVFQEGGQLRDHLLSELPNETWLDFQDEFLNHTE
jgi:glycine cleavage system H protein